MPEEIEALEQQLRSLGLAYMNDGREYREATFNVEVHFHADDIQQAFTATANITESLGIRQDVGLHEWDVNRHSWGSWISPKQHQ